MDSAKLILSEPVSLPSLLGNLNKVDGISEQKKIQAAKDFESVLLQKLLDAMKKTVPESGLFEGGISEQVQDIFWFYLAQDMAKQGGMGLWKTIYEQISQSLEHPKGVSAVENEI